MASRRDRSSTRRWIAGIGSLVLASCLPGSPGSVETTDTEPGASTSPSPETGLDAGVSTSTTSDETSADTSSGPGTSTSAETSASSGSGSSSGEPGPGVLEGRAEKGPLILGSTVVASVLDGTGQPSGETYFGMIDDDAGSFSLELPAGLLGLLVDGYYFDEIDGQVSQAPLSLRGTVVMAGGATSRVNVLTHLRDARALALIAAGTDPELALAQAAEECVLALQIGADVAPAAAVDSLGIFGAGTLDDAYLLAVSATLLQAAHDAAGGGGASGQLQLLLNSLAADLADDGLLEADALPPLRAAESEVDAQSVLSNLAAHAAAVGFPWVPPPLDDVLDRDHDGIANAPDNCPGVVNPGQEDLDGNGEGDACQDCTDPSLPDGDGDGVREPCDNCPIYRNSEQIDSDGDGLGNVCDSCALQPGGAGDACCDPREPEIGCMEPDLAIQNTMCVDLGSGFECFGIFTGVAAYMNYCEFGCAQGPCVAPGVMPVVPAVTFTSCSAGVSCCSQPCSTDLDDCGAHPEVHCIPWYAPGTAPAGFETLGLCVDTVVGPCAGAGAVAQDCAGADW